MECGRGNSYTVFIPANFRIRTVFGLANCYQAPFWRIVGRKKDTQIYAGYAKHPVTCVAEPVPYQLRIWALAPVPASGVKVAFKFFKNIFRIKN